MTGSVPEPLVIGYTFRMRSTLIRGAIIGTIALTSFSGVASAQNAPRNSASDVRPPAPADPGKPNQIVSYALVFLLAAAALGLSVMPSGRSHQN